MTDLPSDDSPGGTVVFLSGDLIFASRVKGAAMQAGREFCLSGSLPETETESIRFVVLDLSTRGSRIDEIVKQCVQRCPQARLIAYGPHVQVVKLAAAREAGIPTVMTKGQFDAKLPTLFR